jgi:hypothetical protein
MAGRTFSVIIMTITPIVMSLKETSRSAVAAMSCVWECGNLPECGAGLYPARGFVTRVDSKRTAD